jgi:DNA-binding NarL/FixJ family response regulator
MDLVIVDDHPAVRAGLRGLIDDEEGLRVAATAASASEGFEAIADVRPAVALIDLSLPDDDGLSLCLRIRSLPEPPRVIIYSAHADILLEVLARIAGAEAVVPKSAPPQVLLDALRGGPQAPLDPRALRAVGARLSTDDLAILGMLAHGGGDEEIAATLGVGAESLLSRRAAMLPRRPLAAA